MESDEKDEAVARKSGYPENFLEKIINTPRSESATPVQRKSGNPLKAIATERNNAVIQNQSIQRQEAAEEEKSESEQEEEFTMNPEPPPVQRKFENRLRAKNAQKMAIQAKLTIGEPNDKYEQEADATAARVVQQINSPMTSQDQPVQRKFENQLRAKNAQKMAIQAKLAIGEPNDKYEQEADATAARVVQQINSPTNDASTASLTQPVQRQEMEEDEELQMKPLVQRSENLGGGEASTDLESAIQSARGSGQSLDANLQQSMGQAMGADFSGVKVHTDSQSDQLNKSIQAKAFTTGQDVFFRQGAYEPGSRGGQELIAHELTHVVQQNGSAVQASQSTKAVPTHQPSSSSHSREVSAESDSRSIQIRENAIQRLFIQAQDKDMDGNELATFKALIKKLVEAGEINQTDLGKTVKKASNLDNLDLSVKGSKPQADDYQNFMEVYKNFDPYSTYSSREDVKQRYKPAFDKLSPASQAIAKLYTAKRLKESEVDTTEQTNFDQFVTKLEGLKLIDSAALTAINTKIVNGELREIKKGDLETFKYFIQNYNYGNRIPGKGLARLPEAAFVHYGQLSYTAKQFADAFIEKFAQAPLEHRFEIKNNNKEITGTELKQFITDKQTALKDIRVAAEKKKKNVYKDHYQFSVKHLYYPIYHVQQALNSLLGTPQDSTGLLYEGKLIIKETKRETNPPYPKLGDSDNSDQATTQLTTGDVANAVGSVAPTDLADVSFGNLDNANTGLGSSVEVGGGVSQGTLDLLALGANAVLLHNARTKFAQASEALKAAESSQDPQKIKEAKFLMKKAKLDLLTFSAAVGQNATATLSDIVSTITSVDTLLDTITLSTDALTNATNVLNGFGAALGTITGSITGVLNVKSGASTYKKNQDLLDLLNKGLETDPRLIEAIEYVQENKSLKFKRKIAGTGTSTVAVAAGATGIAVASGVTVATPVGWALAAVGLIAGGGIVGYKLGRRIYKNDFHRPEKAGELVDALIGANGDQKEAEDYIQNILGVPPAYIRSQFSRVEESAEKDQMDELRNDPAKLAERKNKALAKNPKLKDEDLVPLSNTDIDERVKKEVIYYLVELQKRKRHQMALGVYGALTGSDKRQQHMANQILDALGLEGKIDQTTSMEYAVDRIESKMKSW